ncbi:MAG: hypothetical protein Sylvanvirus4_8 [Sylvanvirus sp.]|uniref:Uncharacterized protein n=1 Tax=Sylvanvirus sp. TaxID=2487774 RepID=A0A3G5AJ23_9VIRU|nr:MAG: hypothetical protein Sylvanvirus4_8 [Sylvanvirus sp.]
MLCVQEERKIENIKDDVLQCLEEKMDKGMIVYSISSLQLNANKYRVLTLPCHVLLECDENCKNSSLESLKPLFLVQIVPKRDNYDWISTCKFSLESCNDYELFRQKSNMLTQSEVEENEDGEEAVHIYLGLSHFLNVEWDKNLEANMNKTDLSKGRAILNISTYTSLQSILPHKESVAHVIHTEDHEDTSCKYKYTCGEVSIWLFKNEFVYRAANEPVCSFVEFKKGPYLL